MLERITVRLSTDEREALQILAKAEMRDYRDQARFIIRKDLEERGLLQPTNEGEDESTTPLVSDA
jgi:hypothetical protein